MRPEPREAPEGYCYDVVPDEAFRLVEGERTCRMLRCRAPAVAEFKRSRRGSREGYQWWAYCPDHLYGRWVENGVVVCWRLVEAKEPPR